VLASSPHTATDGANIILNTGAPLNDEIVVIAFSSFTVANAVVRTGGTMLGALQLFGGDTGVTPAPGDNSTKLATTAFVHAGYAQLGGLSTQQFAVATATVGTNAVNLTQLKQFGFTGSTIVTAGANGTIPLTTLGGTELTTAVCTRALPAAVNAGNGGRIEICAFAAGVNIVPQAGDNFTTVQGTNPALITMALGETAVFESNGATTWYLVGGSISLQYTNSFFSSKAVNGYTKLPSGLIIQWGSGTTNPTGALPVAFPLAFPSAVYQVVVGPQYAGIASVTFGWQAVNNSSFNVYANSAAANNFSFFAIGA
jgi:hypothetical protein